MVSPILALLMAICIVGKSPGTYITFEFAFAVIFNCMNDVKTLKSKITRKTETIFLIRSHFLFFTRFLGQATRTIHSLDSVFPIINEHAAATDNAATKTKELIIGCMRDH